MKLPVSGLELRFQAPDGNDDLAILEAAGDLLERALVVLSRLAAVKEDPNAATAPARAFQAHAPDYWAGLTVTDFEAALLGLRRFLFGDKVACVFRDRSHECGVRMELEFSITAFLDEARPRLPRRVRKSGEPGWFLLEGDQGQDVRFRLPTVEDQLHAMSSADGASLLALRCIDAASARERRRAERAMEEMAPAVSRPLSGECPQCGDSLEMMLYVPRLVMGQMEDQAAAIHEETGAIAAAYHWDEASILAMPQQRRRAYAETILRRERVAV
jgi:hypothetical protein